jgi:hypothetical protein
MVTTQRPADMQIRNANDRSLLMAMAAPVEQAAFASLFFKITPSLFVSFRLGR